MKKSSKRLSPATAVAMISDVHYDERVMPYELSGVHNEYNPDICRKRINVLQENICSLLEIQRSWIDIHDLVVFLGGDLLSNYLHDDLIETNTLPPIKAAHDLVAIVESLLLYLLRYSKCRRMVVVCCYGNHGRITEKKRFKNAAGTSIEWLIYQFLRNHVLKSYRNIHWVIPESYIAYLNIGNFTCRFMHGDLLPSVHKLHALPSRVQKYNDQCVAQYTFIGHFHTATDLESVIVNGSVIGPTAYAVHHGYTCEPAQQMLIIISHDIGKVMSIKVPCWYTPPLRDACGRFTSLQSVS